MNHQQGQSFRSRTLFESESGMFRAKMGLKTARGTCSGCQGVALFIFRVLTSEGCYAE